MLYSGTQKWRFGSDDFPMIKGLFFGSDVDFRGSKKYILQQSRKLTYPTKREKENHRLKSAGWDEKC